MGGGGSKQVLQSDVVTGIMSSIASKNTQSCTNHAAASQIISVTDSSFVAVTGNTLRQRFTVSMSCTMDSSTLETLQNDIATAISQSGEQTTQAVLSAINSLVGEKNKTSSLSSIRNQIKTDITKETMQLIETSLNANQGIIVEGANNVAITNNAQEQIVEQVISVMNKVFSQTALVTEIRNQENQSAKQDQRNPIADTVDSIGNAGSKLLTGIGNVLSAPLRVILLFIFIIIAAIVLGKKLMGVSDDPVVQPLNQSTL